MTQRVVALLRGVNNAGAGARVAMADLRALVEGLGFTDVRTLLNSGNVVFSVPAGKGGGIAARIEKGLSALCGVAPRVIVLSRNDVAAIVRENPFAGVAMDPSRLLVVVPRTRAGLTRLKPLVGMRWQREALALGKRVAWLWCADGVADSALWPAVERALERSGTARNIATMTKLLALLDGPPK